MSVTLSYGFVRPSVGDFGSTFWGQLENDITQLNNHSHNGTDSARLTSVAITAVSNTISTGAWSAVSGQTGTFSATVSCPPNITYDDYGILFQIASGTDIGKRIHLSTVKIDATSFTVYICDTVSPTYTITALYVV